MPVTVAFEVVTAPVRRTSNVSFGSKTVSPLTVTLTVCVVVPGAAATSAGARKLHLPGGMKHFAVFLVFLAVACAPVASAPEPSPQPNSRVFFTAERVSPATVRLALDNGSPDPIGYNLCTSELQRRGTSGWIPVDTGEVCTMEMRTLSPGHDATFEKQLPSGLAAGDYRYVTGIESPLGGSRVVLETDAFTVR